MKILLAVLGVIIFVATNTIAGPSEIDPSAAYPTIDVPQIAPNSSDLSVKPIWHLECGVNSQVVIGRIISAAPGVDGRTLLLDAQLGHVLVVGSNGLIERTVGKHGEGPGDLQGAYRALQLPDGRIGVAGGAPAFTTQIGGSGKIVFLDQSGDPAGTWFGAGDPGSMPASSIRELRFLGHHVLTSSHRMEMSRGQMLNIQELSLLDSADGSRVVVCRRILAQDMNSEKINEEDFYEPFADGRCDVSSSGRIAFAPDRDRWVVAVRDQDGTGFVLKRPWDPIDRSMETMEKVNIELGGTDHCLVLKNEPAIGRIRWRPDGNLWVEPKGIDLSPGAFACFDEFSPAGDLLRRVQIMVPGNHDLDELVVMENGRLIMLRGFKRIEGDNPPEDISTEIVLLEIE